MRADPRKALPLMPSSVSTVTTPSCRVLPKLVPTPVFQAWVVQSNMSTLTLVIFMGRFLRGPECSGP
jgi:hypothetical protein